jgi:hypothetical protein
MTKLLALLSVALLVLFVGCKTHHHNPTPTPPTPDGYDGSLVPTGS